MPRKMDRERHNLGGSKLSRGPPLNTDDEEFNPMRAGNEEACDELLMRLIKHHGIDGRADIYPGTKSRR